MGKLVTTLFPGTDIRVADIYDLDAIDAVDKKKPDPNRVTPRRVIEDRITNKLCLILKQGDEIVAYSMLLIDGEHCEVAKLVSLDGGLPLLQSAVVASLKWLKSTGIRKLVSRCRKELLPLYKRFGFKDAGLIPHFFGFNVPAVAIELIL